MREERDGWDAEWAVGKEDKTGEAFATRRLFSEQKKGDVADLPALIFVLMILRRKARSGRGGETWHVRVLSIPVW